MSADAQRADRLGLILGFGLWCVAVLVVGLPRALARHYHVDEVQIAYESALLSVHDLPDYVSGTAPSMLAVGAAMKHATTSTTMFAIARTAFFALFASKLAACAWSQPYFATLRGRLAVLVAVTLFFPLWLNGFEFRMDVIVSLGAVILYGLAQRADTLTFRGYVLAGVCAATMQANSIKALLYWAPFSLLLLAIGVYKSANRGGRIRIAIAFAAGIVVGVAVNLGFIAATGHLDVYVRGMTRVGSLVGATDRFSPVPELLRLAEMSPLVFALAAARPILVVVRYAKTKELELRSVVTLTFLGWSLVTLFVNPVPFGYNFIHLLPFVFFAALETVAALLSAYPARRLPVLIGIGAVTVGLFGRGWFTDAFFLRTNEAQCSYIRAAEALTAPTDPILDGAGLVLSRKPPHPDWLVHSLRMARYRDGSLTRFATIMREHPSPVILDNYRWNWLSREDLATRKTRYIQMAPRLFVLAERLTAPEADVEIPYPGVYQLATAPGVAVAFDNQPLENGTNLALTLGGHHYVKTGDGAAVLRWIGPHPAAAVDAVMHIESLGRGEPMFTNEARELR